MFAPLRNRSAVGSALLRAALPARRRRLGRAPLPRGRGLLAGGDPLGRLATRRLAGGGALRRRLAGGGALRRRLPPRRPAGRRLLGGRLPPRRLAGRRPLPRRGSLLPRGRPLRGRPLPG